MPAGTARHEPVLSDPRLALVERFFAGTGRTYDGMVHWATLGIDALWKRRIAAAIPERAMRVLDLACGTGLSTFAIARAHPRATVVGVELRDEYLSLARAKLARGRLDNVSFVLSRAEDYRSATPFDCVTASYLAKYADLPRLVESIRSLLVPGGVVLMHDFMFPPPGPLRSTWRAYFAVMRHTVARWYPAWQEIYDGLPKLIESSRWLDELPELLRRAGFEHVRVEPFTLHGSALVSARAP